MQDNVPELQEVFIINITDVQLVDSPIGGQLSVKRLGLETAEITIEENDDARGIFSFNVARVSRAERRIFKLPFQQESLCFQTISSSVLISFMTPNSSRKNGQIPDKQFLLKSFFTINI